MPHVEIKKPGWLTTIQDLGRWGYQAAGVSVSGPMDWISHRLANAIVGNSPTAATLEVTMSGPEVYFENDGSFAVCGAEFPLRLNEAPVMADREPVLAPAGSILSFGSRQRGARAYLAIGGGFIAPPVLGSRSTHVLSRLGGCDGRPLRTGDRLEFASSPIATAAASARRPVGAFTLPMGGARLRVLPGPHLQYFAQETVMKLHSSRYVLSPKSDRMGYRVEGPALPWISNRADVISCATVAGALQVPSAGQPILLMADRATTGGYPMIATVITADVPLAGQLAPGDWIELVPCTRQEAIVALRDCGVYH